MIIIDADGSILGRMASQIAKKLLEGEEITVINAEKALLSGSIENVYEEYSAAYNRGKAIRGPYFPRMPDRIMRRTVRGMLPFRTRRGRDAYRRLHVFIGTPAGIDTLNAVKIATPERKGRYTTLYEISKLLGAGLR